MKTMTTEQEYELLKNRKNITIKKAMYILDIAETLAENKTKEEDNELDCLIKKARSITNTRSWKLNIRV